MSHYWILNIFLLQFRLSIYVKYTEKCFYMLNIHASLLDTQECTEKNSFSKLICNGKHFCWGRKILEWFSRKVFFLDWKTLFMCYEVYQTYWYVDWIFFTNLFEQFFKGDCEFILRSFDLKHLHLLTFDALCKIKGKKTSQSWYFDAG